MLWIAALAQGLGDFKYDAAAYGVLVIGAMLLLEVAKVLLKKKVKGKEPWLILFLIAGLGVGAKLTPAIGLYQQVPWFVHGVFLLFAVGSAFKGHDWVLNRFLGKKDPHGDGSGGNENAA